MASPTVTFPKRRNFKAEMAFGDTQ